MLNAKLFFYSLNFTFSEKFFQRWVGTLTSMGWNYLDILKSTKLKSVVGNTVSGEGNRIHIVLFVVTISPHRFGIGLIISILALESVAKKVDEFRPLHLYL